MLTEDDAPTIRHAITRRLDKEPGVEVCDIVMNSAGDHIAVGVLVRLDARIVTRSRFDLPIPFEHGHLLNEIDEIAEQLKAARKTYFGRGGGFLIQPERQLMGTGLRGRWLSYGLRNG